MSFRLANLAIRRLTNATQFYTDAQSGALPQVSWVIPIKDTSLLSPSYPVAKELPRAVENAHPALPRRYAVWRVHTRRWPSRTSPTAPRADDAETAGVTFAAKRFGVGGGNVEAM